MSRRCGPDPMGTEAGNVDTARVLTARRRYAQQAASPPPSGNRLGGRLETMAELSPVPPSPAPFDTMDELREMEVAKLRERVVRSEYEVDTRAVAGAILARLLAERPAEPGK